MFVDIVSIIWLSTKKQQQQQQHNPHYKMK